MEKVIKIEGGHDLNGTVRISGSKNATVALIPACVLGNEPVTIYGVPNISDVQSLIVLLNELGVYVEKRDEGRTPRMLQTAQTEPEHGGQQRTGGGGRQGGVPPAPPEARSGTQGEEQKGPSSQGCRILQLEDLRRLPFRRREASVGRDARVPCESRLRRGEEEPHSLRQRGNRKDPPCHGDRDRGVQKGVEHRILPHGQPGEPSLRGGDS